MKQVAVTTHREQPYLREVTEPYLREITEPYAQRAGASYLSLSLSRSHTHTHAHTGVMAVRDRAALTVIPG